MSLRFCDSFDHYATAQMGLKWSLTNSSGSTGYSVIQTGGRTANCVKLKSQFLSPNYIQKAFDNQATWIVAGAVNWITDSWGMGVFSLYDGSTRQVSLCINSSGNLYLDKGGTAVSTSSNVWVNGWNYIEFKVFFSGSSSTATVRVNGASWISYTGNLVSSGSNQANIIAIGDYLGSHDNRPILFDDFVVMDGQGSVNNDLMGDVTVDAIFPNASGNYSQFSLTGSGAHYTCVNENPPDGDTTYISSQTTGNRDSFTFTATTNSILTVKGVQLVTDMRQQGSGSCTIVPFTRDSGTNYDKSGIAIGSSYSMYLTVLETSPATSTAWTSTEIAAIEAGVKVG